MKCFSCLNVVKVAIVSMALVVSGRPSVHAAEAIVANFSAGDSSSEVDGFPGVLGDGWAGPWEIVGSTQMKALTASEPALTGNSGKFLKMSCSVPEGQSEGQLVTAAVSRLMLESYQSVDLSKPYEITFIFRPDSQEGEAKNCFIIFGSTSKAGCTGPTDAWLVREGGSAWAWINGDKNGNGVPVKSNMKAIPGVAYHFKIDVDPATQTWCGSINDGTDEVKSGPLGFRTSGQSAACYLAFGTDMTQSLPGASVSASIGSIEIKTIEKLPQ